MKTIKSSILQSAMKDIPEDVVIQVNLSFEIADRIADVLKRQNLSQRDFAKKIKRSEAEVSRWLSGTHNFTLATIAKISAVLGEPIIRV